MDIKQILHEYPSKMIYEWNSQFNKTKLCERERERERERESAYIICVKRYTGWPKKVSH